jgi:hypothetical protein
LLLIFTIKITAVITQRISTQFKIALQIQLSHKDVERNRILTIQLITIANNIAQAIFNHFFILLLNKKNKIFIVFY